MPKIKRSNAANPKTRGKQLERIFSATMRGLMVRIPGLFIQRISEPTRFDKVQKRMIYARKSTVDFTGQYYGTSIWIDTKATSNETSLPLANLKPHQIEIMRHNQESGALCGFIVWFYNLEEMYFITPEQIINFVKETGKKSIPIDFFREECFDFFFQITVGILNFEEFLEKEIGINSNVSTTLDPDLTGDLKNYLGEDNES